ncbi:MAG: hypothetical protein E7254_01765 [Lachnospiraceae bacterium]|nr:hypothetical protein [Lachnospiraceae bacterium]
MKKIISKLFAICLILTLALGNAQIRETKAAGNGSIAISGTRLIKGESNFVTISVKNNTKAIGGIEVFVAFDTQSLSVNNVESSLDSSWELDYKAKSLAKYGRGVHCMIQNTSLSGMTNTDKNIFSIKLGTSNAKLKQSYKFKVYVIDVCDINGNSIKSSYSGDEKSYQCVDDSAKDIDLLGLQYSVKSDGVRIVAAVEPTINGKNVVEYGNVIGFVEEGITENDMYVGNPNSDSIRSFKSTSLGRSSYNFSDSDTATCYIMTIINNGTTIPALTQKYMVRAYAKLSDGTYVYSDVLTYSIYEIAGLLYNEYKMPNEAYHNYLYNNILSVVNKTYKVVKYDCWVGIIG